MTPSIEEATSSLEQELAAASAELARLDQLAQQLANGQSAPVQGGGSIVLRLAELFGRAQSAAAVRDAANKKLAAARQFAGHAEGVARGLHYEILRDELLRRAEALRTRVLYLTPPGMSEGALVQLERAFVADGLPPAVLKAIRHAYGLDDAGKFRRDTLKEFFGEEASKQ